MDRHTVKVTTIPLQLQFGRGINRFLFSLFMELTNIIKKSRGSASEWRRWQDFIHTSHGTCLPLRAINSSSVAIGLPHSDV